MVAEAGAGWVLAPALVELIHQVDAAFPDRPRASDGSIGDARHQAETFSDHNPRLYNGVWYVTALDITAAPFVPELVDDLIRDPRVKYVIWQGRYFQRIAWSADPVGQWVTYHGTDPHTSHVHVSLLLSSSPDNRPWTVPGEETDVEAIDVWNAGIKNPDSGAVLKASDRLLDVERRVGAIQNSLAEIKALVLALKPAEDTTTTA